MKLYKFEFQNGQVEVKEIAFTECAYSYAKKSGGYVRKKDLDKLQGGHMYSHSPNPSFFIKELVKSLKRDNRKYLKKVQDNNTNLAILQDILNHSDIPQSNVLAVKEYFETVNLGNYNLEGCEFTENDFSIIEKRWKSGKEILETVVHNYLLEIREILDAGLEEN